jgi:hypothetical protein
MLNFIIRYIANKFATWKNLQFFNRIGQQRTPNNKVIICYKVNYLLTLLLCATKIT